MIPSLIQLTTQTVTPTEEVEHVASDLFGAMAIIVGILILAAIIIFVVWMHRAASGGRAIVYTSGLDVTFGVFFPLIAAVAGAALLGGENTIAGIVLLCAGAGWLVLHNVGQAIRWNNGAMAVLVAVFRLGFAFVWLISVFMILGLLNPKTKNSQGREVNKTMAQLALAAAIAWGIWRFLTAFITPTDGEVTGDLDFD